MSRYLISCVKLARDTTFDIQHSKFESRAGSTFDIQIVLYFLYTFWISSWLEIRHSTFRFFKYFLYILNLELARDTRFDIQFSSIFFINFESRACSTFRFSSIFLIYFELEIRHSTFRFSSIFFIYFESRAGSIYDIQHSDFLLFS